MSNSTKPATSQTSRINRDAVAQYAMEDTSDFDDVNRGLVAEFDDKIYNPQGELIQDLHLMDFLSEHSDCPHSVNPSMWRQAQLVNRLGLFKVTDHLYQVRFSVAMTIVDAPDGLVIIDTSTSPELSAAGMAMFRKHVNDKPVVAVIYTHTHWDHYGGVKGVVSQEDVASGKIPIVAPGTLESFNKNAIGESVIAGNAMSRRMAYTFGFLLPHSEFGLVTGGISTEVSLTRKQSYIPPTDSVTRTGETRTLGGWEFEFLYAPDTEAPEEMHIWIPAIKALTCAENANHTMHNIQTIRGARTRDARNFARYLDETLVRWGDEVDVHFGPHTWPVWGNQQVNEFIAEQRDMYKYIHDQSLRLANQGLTPLEAAEQVELPDAIGKKWYNRYYHGGLHHNVRAVFHKELGFWDGDPATIWPLLPVDSAKRHVALIGRAKILDEGRQAFADGNYRWAIQVLHHLVFADPDDTEAKQLQADAYEQLGYQMEVPQYRHIFLTAAMELRTGIQTKGKLSTDSPDTIAAMPIDLMFDFAAVHINGPRAAGADLVIQWKFTGAGGAEEPWYMWVKNGVLNARPGQTSQPQLTITGPKPALSAILLNPGNAAAVLTTGAVTTDGDVAVLQTLAQTMDTFTPDFNIVLP